MSNISHFHQNCKSPQGECNLVKFETLLMVFIVNCTKKPGDSLLIIKLKKMY